MTIVKNAVCDKFLIASNYIQPCWFWGKLHMMWNVVNRPLVIIAYILKESSSVTCRSNDKAGSIFCCEFVLLSVATWLLKFRVCAQQWLPDLAIAVVVIDPTGFLGKDNTEKPHLPLLIGHSVCLVHILTVVEEDSCSLGQWDFLRLFWPLSSTEIEAVKYVTKPNHSSDSKHCIHSCAVHLVCTSDISLVEKLRYKGCMKCTTGILTGKGLGKAFRSS